MKNTTFRCYSVSALLLTGLVVFVAVGISVVRLLLPLVSDYKPEVQREVSWLLGQRVEIDTLHADWQGFGPRLILDGVRIYTASGMQVALDFEQAIIEVDVLSSVWHYTFSPRRITLRGVDLDVTRRQDNRIDVRGLRIAGGGAGTGNDSPQNLFSALKRITFDLKDSRVVWQDEIRDKKYLFEDVNVLVDLSAERTRLAGTVRLPSSIGRALHVVMDIKGRLWEPSGWSGRVYEKADGIDVSALANNVFGKDWAAQSGKVDFETWSDWHAGRLDRVSGRLGVRDLQVLDKRAPNAAAPTLLSLDAFSARGLWQAQEEGWRLEVVDLQVTQKGAAWPPGRLSVDMHHADDHQILRAWVDYVRLQDAIPLVMSQPQLPASAKRYLTELAPQGALSDLRLQLRLAADTTPWVSATGRFEDLAVTARRAHKWPGFSGLDGRFSLDNQSGEVLLATRAMRFEYPGLLNEAIPVSQLDGALRWAHEGETWQVHSDALVLHNDDIQAQARVNLSLDETGPFLDLRLAYADGDGAQISRYLPNTLPEPAHRWLDRALVKGRVTSGGLLFYGRPRDFPFRHGQGMFEADFHVADGELNYRNYWPRVSNVSADVLFRNQSMRAELDGGSIYDYQLEHAQVRIDDLKHSVVQIEARAKGPLASVLSYLKNSGIGEKHQQVLSRTRAGGLSETQVSLRIPASTRVHEPMTVKGKLHFYDAALSFPSLDIGLDQLQGVLDFDKDEGIAATDIKGRFRADPVLISAASNKSAHAVNISIEGDLPAHSLLDGFVPELKAHVQGRSHWLASISVPFFEGAKPQDRAELRLSSSLQGVRVDYPSPFAKPAQTSRAFVLRTALGLDGPQVYFIDYQPQISAAIEVAKKAGRNAVSRAEVRFDQGQAVLPKSGIRLAGTLKRFSLQDWKSMNAMDAHGGESSSLLSELENINLQIGTVELFGREINDVRLSARKRDRYWSALINTSLLSGLVAVPLDLTAGLPIALDLDYLHLNSADEAAPAASPIDPRALPAIRLTAKHLTLDDIAFTDVRLETTPLKDGLQVHNLRLSSPSMQAHAYGDWRVSGSNQQRSDFRMDIKSDDVGAALTHLGFGAGLQKGEGTLTASLRWPDAPMHFQWKGVNGKAHILVNKGRLTDVDPGAGRILGLINLQALPRRLIFDFSDMFTEGFSFDTLEGHFAFVDSDAFTSDTVIVGTAAKIQIKGRTGMAARDYDQEVIVHPEVSSTLPVAGALVGGPTVGVAMFVVEKLFSNLGDSLNQAAEVKYKVTGSWDDPKIENLTPAALEEDVSEDPFE